MSACWGKNDVFEQLAGLGIASASSALIIFRGKSIRLSKLVDLVLENSIGVSGFSAAMDFIGFEKAWASSIGWAVCAYFAFLFAHSESLTYKGAIPAFIKTAFAGFGLAQSGEMMSSYIRETDFSEFAATYMRMDVNLTTAVAILADSQERLRIRKVLALILRSGWCQVASARGWASYKNFCEEGAPCPGMGGLAKQGGSLTKRKAQDLLRYVMSRRGEEPEPVPVVETVLPPERPHSSPARRRPSKGSRVASSKTTRERRYS